jgi:predicted amidohydrolase YtcJ
VSTSGRYLLRAVEVDGAVVDCRVRDGVVRELRPDLPRGDGETVLEGSGAALLPGLADHHLHIRALAAARASVDVAGAGDLAAVPVPPGTGWLRLIGASTELGRDAVDRAFPDRPVRVQHRSGALWILNSAAVQLLAPGLDADERRTGQLWRSDQRLRQLLAAAGERTSTDLPRLGHDLARLGLTHLTDATPGLDAASVAALTKGLPQHLLALSAAVPGPGPVKIVVPDHDLPALAGLTARISSAHRSGRPVAIHAVSAVALVLVVAALTDAGPAAGDRIEHAAVCDDRTAGHIAAAGVTVVTQPSLWARRGPEFLRESPAAERRMLWRYGSLRERGVRTAVSSDAPYGDADPWQTIRAAATRQPADAAAAAPVERVPAAAVLRSFLADPLDPGGPPRRIRPGSAADLVLLRAPLASALAAVVAGAGSPVRAVLLAGQPVSMS